MPLHTDCLKEVFLRPSLDIYIFPSNHLCNNFVSGGVDYYYYYYHYYYCYLPLLIYIYMCVCVYIYIYVYVCVYAVKVLSGPRLAFSGCHYLGQVSVIIWAKFVAYCYSGFKRFLHTQLSSMFFAQLLGNFLKIAFVLLCAKTLFFFVLSCFLLVSLFWFAQTLYK